MEKNNICLATVSLLTLVAHISAHDAVTSDLVMHIQRLDAKITQLEGTHRDEIEDLRQQMKLREKECDMKMEELFSRMTVLEKKNKALEEEIYQYHETSMKQSVGERTEENIHETTDNGSSIFVNNIDEKINNDDKTTAGEDEIAHTQTNKATHRRGLLDGINVAFSAYMDHDTNNMGLGQTLIYNQVLLNDGGGYNKHTGIFTAPMGGVYSFSFFIGERDVSYEWVALWVNSENKLEAVADTWHATQDLQGGNTANLKLAKGDVVYVKNLGDGHVEGTDGRRITTFSGFLIYPVESTATVVGK